MNDRELFFDGDSVVSPDTIVDLILDGKPIGDVYVSEITNDINEYNKLSETQIQLKTVEKPLNYDYNIPEEYLNIDIEVYVMRCFDDKEYTEKDDICGRLDRLKYEMCYFVKPELVDFFRTLIYVNETLANEGVVCGVGRGSAVASYVLYLIGTHKIDSYKYKLDFHEFMK